MCARARSLSYLNEFLPELSSSDAPASESNEAFQFPNHKQNANHSTVDSALARDRVRQQIRMEQRKEKEKKTAQAISLTLAMPASRRWHILLFLDFGFVLRQCTVVSDLEQDASPHNR